MKEIKLTMGMVALVDDADFEWLNQWKWHAHRGRNTFYAKRNQWNPKYKKYIVIAMHRLILGLTDPKVFGDHEDGDGLNNQRANLRESTLQQNLKNRDVYGKSKTGVVGVYRANYGDKFYASIRVDKKPIHLGTFNSIEDASLARQSAAIRYFGEFSGIKRQAKCG